MSPESGPKSLASIVTGTAVAPGIGLGKAFVRTIGLDTVPVMRIADRDTDKEIKRFRGAVDKAKRDLIQLEEDLRAEGSVREREIEILEGHRACLEDPVFLADVEKGVREEKLNLEGSLARVISNFARIFELVENSYLKGRVSDIREVASRILGNLRNDDDGTTDPPPRGPAILVTEELRMTDLLGPHAKNIAGVVAENGARTTHATLMARSMRIPMIVGVKGITRSLRPGTDLLVDGSVGTVYPNPPIQVRREYEEMEREFQERRRRHSEILHDPSRTLDGKRIELHASVANPTDLALVPTFEMDGIGLFRTEYPFLQGQEIPTEKALVEEYREAVRAASGRPVVFRLLNVGSARGLTGRQLKREPNPALGRRSLRLLLEDEEVFRLQVRAVISAGSEGRARILLPFVTDLDDLRRAKEFIRSEADKLGKGSVGSADTVEIGVLVEVPGLVPMLPVVRGEVDFMTIGIDNLAQHLMVADRANGLVEGYLSMHQPGLIRTLKLIRDQSADLDLYAYGEMVRDPLYTHLLLGLGIERFCVPPYSMPRVKSIILHTQLSRAREFAEEILQLETRQEIRARLVRRTAELVAVKSKA